MIPAFGVLVLGWNMALVLLLYWVENVLTSLYWTGTIRRHEHLTGKRGHFRNQLGVSVNDRKVEHFASEYRAGGLLFSLIHGIFIAVFAFLLLDGEELIEQWPWVLVLGAMLLLTTRFELQPTRKRLDERSFAWLREQARRSLYPVHAMHVGIVLGGITLGLDQGGTLLVLFIIMLRAAVAWFKVRPEAHTCPTEPPRWFYWFGQTRGDFMAKYWRRQQAEKLQSAEDDELPV